MAFNSFNPLGSFGSGGLFDDGSDEARKRQEQLLKLVQQLYGRPTDQGPNTLFGALTSGFRQGTPLLQEAVRGSKTAGQQSLAALGGAGTQAYANIAREGRAGRSSARQRAVSSGLYSTTAPIESGVTGATSGAIGQLGANLGQAFAGQFQQNAAATNTALSNLAQYYAQKGQATAGLGQGYASALGQYQFQPGQSLFQQLSPLLGYGLGFAMGGPVGGAAGSQLLPGMVDKPYHS